MASLTDDAYYNGDYKTAMGSVTIPADSVNKYLYKASQLIRSMTFGNIDETVAIEESVQMCCCEVAEKLYEGDTVDEDHVGKESEKVGDMSVSYVDSQKQKDNCRLDAVNIIRTDLADTGYLYSGV